MLYFFKKYSTRSEEGKNKMKNSQGRNNLYKNQVNYILNLKINQIWKEKSTRALATNMKIPTGLRHKSLKGIIFFRENSSEVTGSLRGNEAKGT